MITQGTKLVASLTHNRHSTTKLNRRSAVEAFAGIGRLRTRAATIGSSIALLLVLNLMISTSAQASPDGDRRPSPTSCSAGYVGLTYDDGPSDWTRGVSKTLKANKLRATFFMMGSKVEQNPRMVRKVVDDGHIVGNHTFTHPRLTDLAAADVKKEIVRTSSAIKKVTGSNPKLFRPPYGLTNEQIREAAASAGMTEVIWTIDTYDYMGYTAQQIVDAVATAKDGDVILMHDDSDIDITAIPLFAKVLSDKNLCAGKIVPSQDPVHAWDGLDYYAKVVPF